MLNAIRAAYRRLHLGQTQGRIDKLVRRPPVMKRRAQHSVST